MSRRRRRTARRSSEDNVRVAAGWVVERTLASAAPVSSFLPDVLERFEERDQALLRELVLGTLRWLRRVDDVIAAASSRRFEEIERPLRAPLRIGAYQLLFLDRVPPYAAVHEAVEQAGHLTHRGGASFVNAVLRRIARSRELEAWPVEASDEVRRRAIEYSHPDFLVRRWADRLGWERTLELLAANNRQKDLQLLAFRDRGGRGDLAERLIDEGLEVEPAPLSPLGITVRKGSPFTTAAFAAGDCYVQDEVSQVAALLPPPAPGERVLDVAAAPGGKSFALLAWEPDLEITAADVDCRRLLGMRDNARRLGRPVRLVVADAARPAASGPFDRVVVDLPCSGTGTLRKHPELKWRLSVDEIDRLASEGAAVLAASAAAVALGGLLLVVTCSLEPEENEEIVAPFLADNPDFDPVDLTSCLDVSLADQVEAPGRWRTLPAADHDGFTVHSLRRGR